MHKKITMSCVAIAAFAALVAPSASAANLKEGGTTVSVGASIKGKNTAGSNPLLTSAGSLVFNCTSVEMSGTVTADSGGTIGGEIPAGNVLFKGTGSGEDCISALGDVKPTVNSKLCLHVNNSDTVTVVGCGGNVTISVDVTGVTTCKYVAASVSGEITTGAAGKGGINIVEQPMVEEEVKFVCPDSARFDMEFYLTTTDGTGLEFTT